MKLEVGMYVRTGSGYIHKLGYYNENEKRWICVEKYDWCPVYESNVVKASHNIIDLIEVGDYVNGDKVDFVQNNEIIYNHNHPRQLNMFAKDIKSIITREQFSAMEYKIGDKIGMLKIKEWWNRQPDLCKEIYVLSLFMIIGYIVIFIIEKID